MEDEDIWVSAADSSSAKTGAEPTWETFYDRDFQDQSLYLSEAGPRAWDAAVRVCKIQTLNAIGDVEGYDFSDASIISQGDGLKALFMLGMGSESMLLSVDSHGYMKTKNDDTTVSGLSHGLLQSIAKQFGATAQHFKVLETFVSTVRADPQASVTKMAIAGSFDTVVTKVKEHLIDHYTSQRSILQLQDLSYRPVKLLAELVEMTGKLKNEKRDKELLDEVLSGVQAIANTIPWARSVALQILARVTQPYLEAVSSYVGLADRQGTSRGIVKDLERLETSGVAPAKSLPTLFGEREAGLILRTRQMLHLLEARGEGIIFEQPEEGPTLEWGFAWADIERIQEKAEEFSRKMEELWKDGCLRKARQVTTQGQASVVQRGPFDPFGLPDDEVKQAAFDFHRAFKSLSLQSSSSHDALEKSIKEALSRQGSLVDSSIEQPPMSLIPSLSFLPILSTQARLTSQTLLRTLFGPLQLQHHLAIQHAFFHFGSGTFSARLTQSLFSSDLGSTESRRKQRRASPKMGEAAAAGSGNLGLRLGTRTTWPPASSELRLALDGILTDAYHDTFSQPFEAPEHPLGAPSMTSADSVNLLSFAIRPLTENSPAALDAILNPLSLSALDFLQVSYKPPPLLDAIITTSALETYDSSFATLLRMARVLWAARQLVRTAAWRQLTKSTDSVRSTSHRRLHIEAHGLVEILASHFTTAINDVWTRFMGRITAIEGYVLGTDGPDGDIKRSGAVIDLEKSVGDFMSLHALQELHESTLRDIGSALLLRHRQKPARAALDAVFQLVLDVAGTSGSPSSSANQAVTLAGFRARVEAFLAECAKLRNREREKGVQGIAGVESLLESLELAGWSRDTHWWSEASPAPTKI